VVGSLRLGLVLLGAAVAVLGGVEIALLAFGNAGPPLWLLTGFTELGWTYAAAGLVAWWRRPSNRLGAILLVGGLSWIGAGLVNTTVAVLIAAGQVLATVPLAVVVHLLLAFPSGRLRSRASRIVVAAAYAIALVGPAPQYLFTPAVAPDGLLFVADRPDLAALSGWLSPVGGVAMLAAAVILGARLRHAPRAGRRVLAPLYAYGVLAAVFVPATAWARDLLGLGPELRFVLQLVVLAGVPVAFALVLLRGGFARTGQIEELGAWLGSVEAARPTLEQALADTLGDPSLRLVFRVGEGYVDAEGAPAALPRPGSGRAVVEIDQAGAAVGAIVYDASLIADPEPVRAAGRVVGIAVEAQRLTAELRASRDALRRSRLRLVEAADQERRRIAQNLHDGLQVQLVLLALDAAQVAKSADDAADPTTRDAATALRIGIDDAAAALRRTVHDVLPATLIERGLATAVEDLVDRLPLPTDLQLSVADRTLPAAVEATAYFVVAEGLANAFKHSRARRLAVRVTHHDRGLEIEVGDDGIGGASLEAGTGLRGLADRLDVLGGRLVLHSPTGAGTRLLAHLPGTDPPPAPPLPRAQPPHGTGSPCAS